MRSEPPSSLSPSKNKRPPGTPESLDGPCSRIGIVLGVSHLKVYLGCPMQVASIDERSPLAG